MVRAAARGIWNPAGFDPADPRKRRQLSWAIQILTQDLHREMYAAAQQWWSLCAIEQALSGVENRKASQHAQSSLTQYLVALFPWLRSDLLGGEMSAAPEQDYHAMMGRPGEARYDEMLQKLEGVRKLTPEEKEQDRKRRGVETAQE